MQFKTFKLSAVALAMAGIPTFANAALYQVVEVNPSVDGTHQAGRAVSKSLDTNCFETGCSSSGYNIAGDVTEGPWGLDYREELPFQVDYRHHFNSESDLDLYCSSYLGYSNSSCNEWGKQVWDGIDGKGGLKSEYNAWFNGYTSNSRAFITADKVGTRLNPFKNGSLDPSNNPSASVTSADSTNAVVNQITDSGEAVGNSSSAYFAINNGNARTFQRRGFVGSTELLPKQGQSDIVDLLGQSNAWGEIEYTGNSLYKITYGSASVSPFRNLGDDNKRPDVSGTVNFSACESGASNGVSNYSNQSCQYFQFANQASVWLNATSDNQAKSVSGFPNETTHEDRTAQASVKDAAIVTDVDGVSMVGYTSNRIDNIFFSRAVKFTPISPKSAFDQCLDDLVTATNASDCWTRTYVPGLEVRPGGDTKFSYTIANGINNQGVIIGNAKLATRRLSSFSEQMFVSNGSSTTILGTGQSPLFFDGSNGSANGINNKNEVVGKVDTENAQGRMRRQRAFIYLYGNAENLSHFDNQRAWLLDDLTNGSSDSNHYRIADASDINDDGVIAATAFKCAEGYSSTAKDAQCPSSEQTVAVKLVPVANGNIEARPIVDNTVERSGASFGWLALSFLGLAGFFRRRK